VRLKSLHSRIASASTVAFQRKRDVQPAGNVDQSGGHVKLKKTPRDFPQHRQTGGVGLPPRNAKKKKGNCPASLSLGEFSKRPRITKAEISPAARGDVFNSGGDSHSKGQVISRKKKGGGKIEEWKRKPGRSGVPLRFEKRARPEVTYFAQDGTTGHAPIRGEAGGSVFRTSLSCLGENRRVGSVEHEKKGCLSKDQTAGKKTASVLKRKRESGLPGSLWRENAL